MYKVLGEDQKTYGPVSAAQIRQWQAEGRVNNATLLQAAGSNDWKPLSATPEFGTPPVVSMPPPVAAPHNHNMATTGLVFGVLSNVCCCFGIIWAVLGIIFSAIALSQHDPHPQQSGKAMALAGLILSVVGLSWHLFLPFLLGGGPLQHLMWWPHHWHLQ